jgi:hypothetical protein
MIDILFDKVDNDLEPPICLLEFPLLAQYCNDILMAMNEIRQTTPLTLITYFASTLNDSFQRVSDAICRYFKYKPIKLIILYKFMFSFSDNIFPLTAF